MKRKEVEQLLERYRAGTCTISEKRLVETWFNQQLKTQKIDEHMDWDDLEVAIWNRIAPRKMSMMRRWLPYAAAILIAMLGGVWIYLESVRNDKNAVAQEILPGGNRATLTLANGKTLQLDERHAGIIVSDTSIFYAADRHANPVLDQVALSSVDTLVLTTPRGGVYQVGLPDGTEVWLNASSELRYPVRFGEGVRSVSLVGEAFFDVRPLHKPATNLDVGSKIPFRVKTPTQTVEVLGTTFNLSAYPEDDHTVTTLVTGRVRVTPRGQEASAAMLIPGMQSSLRGSRIQVWEVDTSIYTAWKAGVFRFERETLASIMRKMERWYDIQVDFADAVEDLQFSGTISRYKNGKDVLEMLSTTDAFQYDIRGKQVTLRKNKGLEELK